MSLEWVSPADALMVPITRIIVAGASGAGKTSLCRTIGSLHNLTYVEMDGLYYAKNWQRDPHFIERVEQLCAGDRWITEWCYPQVTSLLLQRCQLAVWLDYPRVLTMTSVFLRSVLRALHDERLWRGNKEVLLGRPWGHDHPLRYAWITQRQTEELVSAADRSPRQVNIVRLSRPHQKSAWLEQWADYVYRRVDAGR